jgi:hypothetical protein
MPGSTSSVDFPGIAGGGQAALEPLLPNAAEMALLRRKRHGFRCCRSTRHRYGVIVRYYID